MCGSEGCAIVRLDAAVERYCPRYVGICLLERRSRSRVPLLLILRDPSPLGSEDERGIRRQRSGAVCRSDRPPAASASARPQLAPAALVGRACPGCERAAARPSARLSLA